MRTDYKFIHGHFPRRLACIISIPLLVSPLWAGEFSGKWSVYKVDMPDNYYGEIKYPKQFELIEKDEKLRGGYTDQYGYSCEFPLAEVVNGGNELLLMNCGVTKHSDAWAPLHKVKKIDGELVGSVLTYDRQFVWHARQVDGPAR
jgi:hypothetical protein